MLDAVVQFLDTKGPFSLSTSRIAYSEPLFHHDAYPKIDLHFGFPPFGKFGSLLLSFIPVIAWSLCVSSRHSVAHKRRPSHACMAALYDVKISVQEEHRIRDSIDHICTAKNTLLVAMPIPSSKNFKNTIDLLRLCFHIQLAAEAPVRCT